MKTDKLTKDNILARVSAFDLLNHYLRAYHPHGTLRQGQCISNPFIRPKKQKTPSFNIYKVNGGKHWRYKDFATGEDGDAFDLIQVIYHCDFYQALMIINNDFSLGLTIKY